GPCSRWSRGPKLRADLICTAFCWGRLGPALWPPLLSCRGLEENLDLIALWQPELWVPRLRCCCSRLPATLRLPLRRGASRVHPQRLSAGCSCGMGARARSGDFHNDILWSSDGRERALGASRRNDGTAVSACHGSGRGPHRDSLDLALEAADRCRP